MRRNLSRERKVFLIASRLIEKMAIRQGWPYDVIVVERKTHRWRNCWLRMVDVMLSSRLHTHYFRKRTQPEIESRLCGRERLWKNLSAMRNLPIVDRQVVPCSLLGSCGAATVEAHVLYFVSEDQLCRLDVHPTRKGEVSSAPNIIYTISEPYLSHIEPLSYFSGGWCELTLNPPSARILVNKENHPPYPI